jgi:5-methylthioribose kinase
MQKEFTKLTQECDINFENEKNKKIFQENISDIVLSLAKMNFLHLSIEKFNHSILEKANNLIGELIAKSFVELDPTLLNS